MMKKFSILVLAMLFVLGMATAAFAASYNADTSLVYTATPMPDSRATTDAQDDNGILNANGTGVGVGGQTQTQSVIKNAADLVDPLKKQATHGSYQNNTNSCASCHQTHTGAAEGLLFKDSVYTTCIACHDGTLGIYNVFSGSTAGTFAGTSAGNASMHLANGSLEINAAPGGKAGGEDKAGGVEWADEFSCASCHAPHGSYSDRLLKDNANGIQSSTPLAGWAAFDEAGRKAVNVKVYGASGTAIPDPANAQATDKIVLFDTEANLQAAVGTTLADYANTAAAANANIASGDYVALYVYKVNLGTTDSPNWKWSVDTTPWLYGYEGRTNGTYWTQLKKTDTQNVVSDDMAKVVKPLTKYSDQTKTTNMGGIYMFGKGYMFIKASFTAAGKAFDPATNAFTNYKWMDISQPNIVKFDFNAPQTVGALQYKTVKVVLAGGKNTYSEAKAGTKLSAFCAACHVDYMVGAGDADGDGNGNGTYTEAYRHNTASASYACLICHYAHGTDVTVMNDALNQGLTADANQGRTALVGGDTAANRAYLLDSNPSSALKRYTNMSVCWRCHTSSHAESFLNGNTDYYNNYDNRPHGY